MVKQRMILGGVFLLFAAVLFAPLLDGWAGEKQADKKEEKKKKGTKKGNQLLNKSDELTQSDQTDTNPIVSKSRRKVYTVKLSAGKAYQIDLKSKDFDAFLRLEDPAGKELVVNDDVAGSASLDSRIYYKVTKPGEYRVVATSLDGKLGKFTLTVAEIDDIPSASIFKAKAVDLAVKDGKARHEGELTAKSPTAAGRQYAIFSVNLEEGKIYQITQRNNGSDKAFDSYLFLEDADGKRVAANDDYMSGSLDAQILFKDAKTGAYRVICTTLGRTPPHGKFVLEISTVEPKAKGGKK
jgi:hypothetical protein